MSTTENKWRQLVNDANLAKSDLLADKKLNLTTFATNVGGVTPKMLEQYRDIGKKFPPEVRAAFPNLSWPHYLSALSWADWRWWLTKANERNWSPLQMRQMRFERPAANDA